MGEKNIKWVTLLIQRIVRFYVVPQTTNVKCAQQVLPSRLVRLKLTKKALVVGKVSRVPPFMSLGVNSYVVLSFHKLLNKTFKICSSVLLR